MADHRTVTVDGMSCTGCEETVEEAPTAVPGVASAAADHEAGTVRIAGDASADEVGAAVDKAGYEVVG